MNAFTLQTEQQQGGFSCITKDPLYLNRRSVDTLSVCTDRPTPDTSTAIVQATKHVGHPSLRHVTTGNGVIDLPLSIHSLIHISKPAHVYSVSEQFSRLLLIQSFGRRVRTVALKIIQVVTNESLRANIHLTNIEMDFEQKSDYLSEM